MILSPCPSLVRLTPEYCILLRYPYFKENIKKKKKKNKMERVKKRAIKNGLRAEENHLQGETSGGQPP